MGQFPAEVQSGSIAVKDDNETAMAAQAKITSSEAAQIAQKGLPGKVVQTRLDDENGYLVWEVEVIGDQGQKTQLKIDAGDGRLLAVEAGETAEHEGASDREHRDGDREDQDEGTHSSWKLWEHNDQDERGAEHS